MAEEREKRPGRAKQPKAPTEEEAQTTTTSAAEATPGLTDEQKQAQEGGEVVDSGTATDPEGNEVQYSRVDLSTGEAAQVRLVGTSVGLDEYDAPNGVRYRPGQVVDQRDFDAYLEGATDIGGHSLFRAEEVK